MDDRVQLNRGGRGAFADPQFGVAWAVVALIAGALWLRALTVPYLAACAVATALAIASAPRRGAPGRRRSLVLDAALVVLCVVAALGQRDLHDVDTDWAGVSSRLRERGMDGARVAIEEEGRLLVALARRALDAPAPERRAFEALEPLAAGGSERGIVLYRGGKPFAWSGTVRASVQATTVPVDVLVSPMYLSLRVTSVRGDSRAVAVALIHANSPADHIARPLDALLARRFDIPAFTYAPVTDPGAPGVVRVAGVPVMRVGVAPLDRAAVRLEAIQRIRYRNGAILALALVLLIAAAWQRSLGIGARAALIAGILVAVAVAPLSAFSNATRLFDPAVYFAPLGGPFTYSLGALGLTASLLLLGILSLQREHVRLPRAVAIAALLLLVSTGPFLLRDLARGISAPPWGVSVGLWAAWQGTLFLAAMVVLVGTVTIGRSLVGHSRGIAPSLAVFLAVAAGTLGPLLWRAPSGWPDWYAALWAAAIASLALGRRTRHFLVTATIVAGTGAATLVWGSTARRRVELATRDVNGLSAPEDYAVVLLDRLAVRLGDAPPPRSRVELLQLLAGSDIAAAGFPAHLAAWDARDTVRALVNPAPFTDPWDALLPLVNRARREGRVLTAQSRGVPGVQLLLAVPHADSSVTTAVVAPRTRLIPDPPFGVLVGMQSPGASAEPPYRITLVDAHAGDTKLPREGRWTRIENELHGDWQVPGPDAPMRAHVDVDLRSLSALIQRGVLLLLGNLLVLGILWGATIAAGGGVGRWLRTRRRKWLRSYRARLTVALFAFFIVPALAFAAWSYQRLLSDDVQSRALLVGETLRAAAASGDSTLLQEIASNFDTPLFLFADGELASASDDLYREVSPMGRFLPPDVMLGLGLGDEMTAARSFMIGNQRVVLGYRSTQSATGDRYVLAAPARSRELALEARRRDLAILVAFATALGGVAALWLSGVAARELASPIGALRHAAQQLAAGDRIPALAGAPPSEFQPVFSAFREMAADLDASRRALEEAERRTSTVLRDVASGVVAFDRRATVSLANPRARALLRRPLTPGTRLEDGSPLAARVRAFVSGDVTDDEFDVEIERRQLHGRLTRLERGSGGAVLTLDDVTELARAQRVLAWGEMARQVAHEIKNPLTPIRLGVQHLKRARADSRVDFDRVLDTNVERILAEIDRLDEIARAFSRYGLAPDQRVPPEPTDVAAIAADTVQLERLGQSPVEWHLEGAGHPAIAMANGEEFREVLLNILENARLAKARRVDVRILRAGREVQVEVRDDGEGIPADVLPRIFEPHFSTRTSGSGLGLAISRRLVEGWGGEIRVSSRAHVGTTVVIALAASDADGHFSGA